MKNNENKEICSKCAGRCCKHMSGSVFPEQLAEINKETLLQMVKDGYCFDYWVGNPTNDNKYDWCEEAYYLRPKHRNRLKSVVDASWGGECSFLLGDKCKLDFNSRPLECQGLKPSHNRCKSEKYNKHTSAIAWLPYNDIIIEVIEEAELT